VEQPAAAAVFKNILLSSAVIARIVLFTGFVEIFPDIFGVVLDAISRA